MVPVLPSKMPGNCLAAYISSSVTMRSGSTLTPRRWACLAHADVDGAPSGADDFAFGLREREARLDDAECDRVDVDAHRSPLLGERAHQPQHAGFGRGVVGGPGQSADACLR